ncbi:MAG: Holliday junction resolvase RuvX [Ignavibacteria bacterium]
MTTAEERILSIDFGRKRIGIALSDPLKIFAYPYKTILNDHTFWKTLLKILNENKVIKILLGYPLKEDGKKSESTFMVERFKLELEAKTPIPVIYWDERYSSVTAKSNIIASVTGKKKRQDKGLVDRNAAYVILQEYLNEISNGRQVL